MASKKSLSARIVFSLGLLASSLVTIGFSQSQSHAAGLPTIKVISPTFNPANDTFVEDKLAGYGYAVGGHSYYMYIGAGSTISLAYLVTTDGTTPSVGTTINLQVNAPYSISKAKWSVNGQSAAASSDSPTGYGLQVSGVTDATGKVSFTLLNTDTTGLEEIPASETAPRLKDGRLYGNIKAVINGVSDAAEIADLVTFDITKAAASTIGGAATTPTPVATPTATPSATPTPTAPPVVVAKNPSVRLVSPNYDDKNSVDTSGDLVQYYTKGVRGFYTYITAGETLVLKYHVTTDGSKAAANQVVNLQINSPYSKSTASWSSAGKASTAAKDSGDGFGLQVTGTTDANGDVTFTVKNTNTANLEAKPAAPNSKAPATRLYGTFKPVLPGVADSAADTDLATFDVTAGDAVAQKVASIAASLKVGKTAALPATSSTKVAIKWASTTPTTCTVAAGKVTAKKAGACVLTASNAGNASSLALASQVKVTITK